MVLDIDARHPVAGGRLKKGVIKSDFQRTGFDFAIPVRSAFFAKAEMPLANQPGLVARLFQNGRQRGVLRINDERGVAGKDAGAGFAPRILAGEHRVTRRRAGGGRGVGIGEAQPLLAEPVNVRRGNFGAAVTAGVSEAQVVGKDNYNVGHWHGLVSGL